MEYMLYLATLFALYAIVAVSLNLVVGYTGLISVAHAAFFGIGAYAVAILGRFGVNFFLALLIGGAVSGVVSLLIGFVLSRFRDDYYLLASLGFNYIVFSIFLNWEGVTRGPLGIPGIIKPVLGILRFSDSTIFFLLTLICSALVYLCSRFIVTSSFGRVLKAIREDEKAAQVFGYHVHYYKLTIFVISAMMVSLAGSLFGSFLSFIDPNLFNIAESVFMLSIIILGGLANLEGSIIGALFLVLLPELLRFVGFSPDIAAQMRQVVYGLLLIFFMLYRPQGLMGEYKL